MITIKLTDGSERSIKEHAKHFDRHYNTIYGRIQRGERDPEKLGKEATRGRRGKTARFNSDPEMSDCLSDVLYKSMVYDKDKHWQIIARFT